jgi:hypothetical protein
VDNGRCLLRWQPGDTVAIAMLDSCAADPRYPAKKPDMRLCGLEARVIEQAGGTWREAEAMSQAVGVGLDSKGELSQRAAALAGQVELRPVQGRQLFIGGQPAGPILR